LEFVEEIPQHHADPGTNGRLVDKFHAKNLFYFIALDGDWVVSLAAANAESPFSVEARRRVGSLPGRSPADGALGHIAAVMGSSMSLGVRRLGRRRAIPGPATGSDFDMPPECGIYLQSSIRFARTGRSPCRKTSSWAICLPKYDDARPWRTTPSSVTSMDRSRTNPR